MTKGLKIGAGDLVTMTNVALPVGSFIKIQPQSVDFLDITDPRAVYGLGWPWAARLILIGWSIRCAILPLLRRGIVWPLAIMDESMSC